MLILSAFGGYLLIDWHQKQPLAVPAPLVTGTPEPPIMIDGARLVWEVTGGTERFGFPSGVNFGGLREMSGSRMGTELDFRFYAGRRVHRVRGEPGTAEGQFANSGVGGVAFDEQGNIYVSDAGNKRIQKFDANRNFVTGWGNIGNGDGTFMRPGDVAIDSGIGCLLRTRRATTSRYSIRRGNFLF